MTTSCRNWWQNCTQEADAEILVIDTMMTSPHSKSSNVAI